MKTVVPVLTYSRVSGYYNPTVSFNKGKKEEYSERKYLDVNKALQMDKGDVAYSGQ
jgi:hypothetical protein